MVERQGSELRCTTGLVEAAPLLDWPIAFQYREGGRVVRPVHHNHLLDAGQLPQNLAQALAQADGLAGILVLTAGNQDFWLDLAETVKDAAAAEIRGAG